MSNRRAMSSQSPSNGHCGNQNHLLLFFLQPSFYSWAWGYVVWNISLASSGQSLQLCSLPTSCSRLGCAGRKDDSRWAPMRELHPGQTQHTKAFVVKLCGFLGKTQQISCSPYCLYNAPITDCILGMSTKQWGRSKWAVACEHNQKQLEANPVCSKCSCSEVTPDCNGS